LTGSRVRQNDPTRRQRIIEAALEVISEHGVAATTHRRIAAAAAVPLGSVTYYFTSLEDLLTAAFLRLAAQSSEVFRARLEAANDPVSARDAVIDIIAGSIWAEPRTLLLSYELYAFAARHPPVSAVMQQWMDTSRAALGRFFDPLTARALDALIEGIGIHNSIDRDPLDRDSIGILVERVAGV
jgi:DNA-binding transcriptional regulator YbjK